MLLAEMMHLEKTAFVNAEPFAWIGLYFSPPTRTGRSNEKPNNVPIPANTRRVMCARRLFRRFDPGGAGRTG